MLIGFSIFGAVLWYKGPEPDSFSWHNALPQKVAIALWSFGALLAITSVGPRSIAVPVYVAWMKMAMCMGTIMTFVTLSVMFLVLLPVFSLIRLSDPLRMKLKPTGESYWEEYKEHEPTLERTARPF